MIIRPKIGLNILLVIIIITVVAYTLSPGAALGGSFSRGGRPGPGGPGGGDPFDPASPAARGRSFPGVEKIQPPVWDSLEAGGTVEVLVMLQEQADTAWAARAARLFLPLSAPPGQEKEARGRAVVDALQEKARETQPSLLNYLEREKEGGRVLEYDSYYVVNVIYLVARGEVVEALARLPQVRAIYPNERVELQGWARGDPPGTGGAAGGDEVLLAAENWSNGETTDTTGNGVNEKNTENGINEISAENGENPGGLPERQVEWNVAQVGAPDVWDMLGYDGTGVVVGLLDTGVYWEHPDLREKWRGYDPEDPGRPDPIYNWYDSVNREPMPRDIYGNGHGTHVLGTILGSAPGGGTVTGVAPGARWIAANAFSPQGATFQTLLEAGEYLLAPWDPREEERHPRPDLAPHIINNSWGRSSMYNDMFKEMVTNWRNAGILPVFSAGNSGPGSRTLVNPAHLPGVLTVAATDRSQGLAHFSSRGPGAALEPVKPDISAPGVGIRSTVPPLPAYGHQGYGSMSGTSMAAAHVSGAAALVLSAEPALGVEELEQTLRRSAVPLTDDQYPETPNHGYGYGQVDAFWAVSRALGYEPASGITLDREELTLVEGGQAVSLRVGFQPENVFIRHVHWESDDPGVAVVDPGGRVTPVGPGQCNIKVIVEGTVQAGCAVTVKEKEYLPLYLAGIVNEALGEFFSARAHRLHLKLYIREDKEGAGLQESFSLQALAQALLDIERGLPVRLDRVGINQETFSREELGGGDSRELVRRIQQEIMALAGRETPAGYRDLALGELSGSTLEVVFSRVPVTLSFLALGGALEAASEAIQALPGIEELTLAHREAVGAARALVEDIQDVWGGEKVRTADLDRLEALEARLWELELEEAGDCFIATAAYGSPLDPAVRLLKRFRDERLAASRPGQALVDSYYRHSPPAARYIASHPVPRSLARATLLPVTALAYLALHPAPALFLVLLACLVLVYCRRKTAQA